MNINAVDLRQLRYFVTVAEELHFGRAAKRLFMSQPPLSQQIKALEGFLGVELFWRTRRKVELTPAGAYLLPEARRLLREMGRIAMATKEAEAGLHSVLRVGLNFSAPFHPFTATLLERFHVDCPQVKVEVVLHDKPNLLQLVDIQTEQLDLALIWLDDGHKNAHIERLDLAHDVLDVVVPAKHPLAAKKKIHIGDLVGLPFIGQGRHSGTQRYDAIMQAFDTIKAQPHITSEIQQMPLMMSMVSAGQGVTLLPRFLAKVAPAGLVFRPLTVPKGKPPCMTYNLIAPSKGQSPAARCFIQLAARLAKD